MTAKPVRTLRILTVPCLRHITQGVPRFFWEESNFMNQTIASLLEQFPQGILLLRDGTVLSANAAARDYLPLLAQGAPLPETLAPIVQGGPAAGAFSLESGAFLFNRSACNGTVTLLFSPAPQSVLTTQQLHGFLRSHRQSLEELLQSFQLLAGDVTAGNARQLDHRCSAFSRAFHQAFRLMSNLDYLCQIQEGEDPFSPTTLDLAGLGHQIARQAGDVLSRRDIAVTWHSSDASLLVPGDPTLLRQLLLGLISNAAKAAGCRTIALALTRKNSRAVFTVSNDGEPLTQDQLTRLFLPPPSRAMPQVSQGAGMGLTIVRHIVSRHQGAILMEAPSKGGLCCTLSLPTGATAHPLPVRTPADRTGGLASLLVELSEVLPTEVFSLEDLE